MLRCAEFITKHELDKFIDVELRISIYVEVLQQLSQLVEGDLDL